MPLVFVSFGTGAAVGTEAGFLILTQRAAELEVAALPVFFTGQVWTRPFRGCDVLAARAFFLDFFFFVLSGVAVAVAVAVGSAPAAVCVGTGDSTVVSTGDG